MPDPDSPAITTSCPSCTWPCIGTTYSRQEAEDWLLQCGTLPFRKLPQRSSLPSKPLSHPPMLGWGISVTQQLLSHSCSCSRFELKCPHRLLCLSTWAPAGGTTVLKVCGTFGKWSFTGGSGSLPYEEAPLPVCFPLPNFSLSLWPPHQPQHGL